MSSYTIPNVIAEHPRGDRIMDVYSHLLTERIVVLGTAIDPGVANTLTAQLIYLEAHSPDQEINLYINCEGGDIPSMLAIYDTMQFIQAPVSTFCIGQAVGAGAVLLAAGGKGRRAMLPHARVILHQPAVSGQGADPRPDPRGRRGGPAPRRVRIGAFLPYRPVRGGAAGRHRPGPDLHRPGRA